MVDKVIEYVNRLLALCLRYERTVRRGLLSNGPGVCSRAQLEEATKITDSVLTQHQRVANRFGGPKKPDLVTVQLDRAKILQGILDVMTGIYDVMRFWLLSH